MSIRRVLMKFHNYHIEQIPLSCSLNPHVQFDEMITMRTTISRVVSFIHLSLFMSSNYYCVEIIRDEQLPHHNLFYPCQSSLAPVPLKPHSTVFHVASFFLQFNSYACLSLMRSACIGSFELFIHGSNNTPY